MSSVGNDAPGSCTVLESPSGKKEYVGVECSGYTRYLFST